MVYYIVFVLLLHNCDFVHKTYTRSEQSESQHRWEIIGETHKVLSLAKKVLAIDYCWGKESKFPLWVQLLMRGYLAPINGNFICAALSGLSDLSVLFICF